MENSSIFLILTLEYSCVELERYFKNFFVSAEEATVYEVKKSRQGMVL
jgi:hypothetical protein